MTSPRSHAPLRLVVDRQRHGRPSPPRRARRPWRPRQPRRHRDRRRAPARLRPGRPQQLLRRTLGGRPVTWSSRGLLRRTRHPPAASTTRSSGSTGTGRTVTTASGLVLGYDRLVLATGSTPFVPPIDGPRRARVLRVPHHRRPRGHRRRGRDGAERVGAWWSAAACSAWRRPTPCRTLGLETHVVEFAPRLMPVQLDDGGAPTLPPPHRGASASRSTLDAPPRRSISDGTRPTALTFDGHRPARRPTSWCSPPASGPGDDLARAADLAVGERGGIVVDDALATDGSGGAGHRRVRARRRPGLRAGRSRATRWPGSSPPTSTPPARGADARATASCAPTCRPSSSCWASAWPTWAIVHGTPTPTPSCGTTRCGGHYRRLDVDERRAGSWPPCSSATPRRTPRSSTTSAAAMRPATIRGRCSSAPGPPTMRRSPTTPIPHRWSARARTCCRGAIDDAITDGGRTVADLKGATRAGSGCGGCVPLRRADPADRTRAPRRGRGRLAVRALRPRSGRAVRPDPGPRPPVVRRGPRAATARAPAAARSAARRSPRSSPRLDTGPHPRRRAGRAPGHQRPLPRQPPAGRHLLGRPPHPRAARSPRRS